MSARQRKHLGQQVAVLGSLCAALLLVGCSSGSEPGMVGTLERDRVEIKVETSEPIVSRHVQDGATVAAGDLVMRQNPSRPQARLDRARAQQDQAAARLAELQRGPRREAILETGARLAAAEAQTANARAEFKRISDVFSRGLASASARDDAQARWQTAAGAEQAIRENLQAQLAGTTVEELKQAEAELAAADAELAQTQIDLQRTELRAPVDGVVDKLLFQIGERPPVGTTVAVLLDSSRVFARIYVPEFLRATVVPGTELTVRVDGLDEDLRGTVRWVSTDASFTPYFALTEYDRSRLSYLAEVDVPGAADLPSGVPLSVLPPGE
ncbi:MAG: HlyD family efflux transporter periplasmic adaptor subunit [Xanthomonadales bacterium]|nr:HlyD family efflux transporter periplasmic adaptor subunit [Xanthomonadales bacterium]